MFYRSEKIQQNQLIVIDGTALLFRAYYGANSQISTEGLELNGVLGMSQKIRELLRALKPKFFYIVFDAGQKTFRNEIDSSYKANRGEPPEDLKHQFDIAYNFCIAAGFPTLKLVGYEADDLMATLAELAKPQKLNTLLVSVDKDLYQLITDDEAKVYVFDHTKQHIWNSSNIEEKMTVKTHQLVDYFALVGDSVDNIKGVKGIGPKAASWLLNEFNSLDKIYQSVDEIAVANYRGAKSIAKKLQEQKGNAYLSKQLVTLKRDCPLGFNSDQLKEYASWEDFSQSRLSDFFEDLDPKYSRRIKAFSDLAEMYEIN